MNNLLDFIRKYCYVLLFLLFETFSFVLLFRFNSYQGSVWFSAANSGVAAAGGLYDDVRAYLHLKDVNRELTDQNLALQRETELLRQALKDATKDSTVTEKLMHDRLKGFELIPATVVSNSAERADNYLVIDKGTQHGVRPEMGVVSGGGVVGIVYLAGPNYSLIIPVTNRKSSISCRVRGQNYFGYLQWDGQSMLSAYVDDVPRYAITLTVPTLTQAAAQICVVPAAAKAAAVRATVCGPIGSECPASALRLCRDARMYLDADSAALIESV